MKRSLIVFVLMVLATILMAKTAKTGAIIVQVRDLGGKSLQFANVVCLQGEKRITGGQTDKNGKVLIMNIPEGSYRVKCSLVGYDDVVLDSVQVKVDQKTSLSIAMTQSGVMLTTQTVNASGVEISDDLKADGNVYAEKVYSIPNMTWDIQVRGGRANEMTLTDKSTSASRTLPPYENSYYPDTNEFSKLDYSNFVLVKNEPLSTFSIDVDTGSYGIVRRIINDNQLPPANSIRTEELLNYFTYDYPQPTGKHPFAVYTELGTCPWNEKRELVHIGLQGKNISFEETPVANLVFLIDVSGSMSSSNKLPLVKQGLNMLLENLRSEDRVAIVTYASGVRIALQSTSAGEKQKIKAVIDGLSSGGGTSGSDGIQQAYRVAMENFIKNGNNRIILCTDGDFNIGISNTDELVKMVADKRKDGIYLSIMGFGMGNYKDNKMELLSNNGNGNYAYIDNALEAKKVFVSEMSGTLFTIAKDVKIQVEFNPANVKAYRLIGYENRLLAPEDFKDDTKDAGEIGAGHSVTALYEIIPADSDEDFSKIDELKYQPKEKETPPKVVNTEELLTVKLRYKLPESDTSIPFDQVQKKPSKAWKNTSENFRFSAAVVGFAMILQNSPHKGDLTWKQVLDMAKEAKGKDSEGYRAEFIRLAEMAELMK